MNAELGKDINFLTYHRLLNKSGRYGYSDTLKMGDQTCHKNCFLKILISFIVIENNAPTGGSSFFIHLLWYCIILKSNLHCSITKICLIGKYEKILGGVVYKDFLSSLSVLLDTFISLG